MTVRTNILISFVRGSSSTQPVTLSFCVGVVVEIRSAGCFLCWRPVVTHLSPVSGDGERNFISVRNIHPSYLSAETLISTSASHTSPLCPSPILSFSLRLLSFFPFLPFMFCLLSVSVPLLCLLSFAFPILFPFAFIFPFPPVPFLYRNSLHLRFYFHFLLFLWVSFPFLILFLSFMFCLPLVLQFLSCISFPLFCCPFLFPFAFIFPPFQFLSYVLSFSISHCPPFAFFVPFCFVSWCFLSFPSLFLSS